MWRRSSVCRIPFDFVFEITESCTFAVVHKKDTNNPLYYLLAYECTGRLILRHEKHLLMARVFYLFNLGSIHCIPVISSFYLWPYSIMDPILIMYILLTAQTLWGSSFSTKQIKSLMSKNSRFARTFQVMFLYISLPSSAKQQREMIKFKVFWRT